MTRFGRMSIIVLSTFVFAGLVLGAPVFAQEEPAQPAAPQQAQAQRVFRDAQKVIIDGKADANGVLSLTFEPQGAEAKLVRVNVLAKAKPKAIAQDLAKQLEFTAGANYKVKSKDNKITVSTKNKKVPVFYLGIEEQSLAGVSVRVTKP